MNSYGNLYFANDAFPGCEKAEVIGALPQSLKDVVKDRFVIGPVVDQDFWHRERASMDIDRGPCQFRFIKFLDYGFTDTRAQGYGLRTI
jgi:uridine phosphorylase